MEQKQATVEQQSGKEEKKFNQNLTKLTRLLGADNLKIGRVKNNDLKDLVDEMLKEEREETHKKFKDQGKAVIRKYFEFQKFVKQQENELKKKVEEQMAQFNKEVSGLFQLIEDQSTLHKDLAQTLENASTDEEIKEQE